MNYLEVPRFFSAAMNAAGNNAGTVIATENITEDDQVVARLPSFKQWLQAGETSVADAGAEAVASIADSSVEDSSEEPSSDGDAPLSEVESAAAEVVVGATAADPKVVLLTLPDGVSPIAGHQAGNQKREIAQSDDIRDLNTLNSDGTEAVWLGWDLFMNSRSALHGTNSARSESSSAMAATDIRSFSSDALVSVQADFNPSLSLALTADHSAPLGFLVSNAEKSLTPKDSLSIGAMTTDAMTTAISDNAIAVGDDSAVVAMVNGGGDSSSLAALAEGSAAPNIRMGSLLVEAAEPVEPSLAWPASVRMSSAPLESLDLPSTTMRIPVAKTTEPSLLLSSNPVARDSAVALVAHNTQFSLTEMESQAERWLSSIELSGSLPVSSAHSEDSPIETLRQALASLPTASATGQSTVASSELMLSTDPNAALSVDRMVIAPIVMKTPTLTTPVIEVAQESVPKLVPLAQSLGSGTSVSVGTHAQSVAGLLEEGTSYPDHMADLGTSRFSNNDLPASSMRLTNPLGHVESEVIDETWLTPTLAKAFDTNHSARSIRHSVSADQDSLLATAPAAARPQPITHTVTDVEDLPAKANVSETENLTAGPTDLVNVTRSGLTPATNVLPTASSRVETTPPIFSSPITDVIDLRQTDWERTLGQQLNWMVNHRMREASIQVNPPNLGPIEIKISQQHNQTNVTFFCHETAVREAIENAMPKLREMFNSQGISLNQAQVSDQSLARHQGGASDQLPDSRDSGDRLAVTSPDQTPETDSDSIGRQSRSLLGIIDHYV